MSDEDGSLPMSAFGRFLPVAMGRNRPIAAVQHGKNRPEAVIQTRKLWHAKEIL